MATFSSSVSVESDEIPELESRIFLAFLFTATRQSDFSISVGGRKGGGQVNRTPPRLGCVG